MLFQSTAASSPLHSWELHGSSSTSPHTHVLAISMPDERREGKLPSFNDKFGEFVPRPDHASHRPDNSSHNAQHSIINESPSKRRFEEDGPFPHSGDGRGRRAQSDAYQPHYDGHFSKRRSEAGIYTDSRRPSDAYLSSNSTRSGASLASSSSYPHVALPPASPSGPPTQAAFYKPLPAPGPPHQPFSAFSSSQHGHRASLSHPPPPQAASTPGGTSQHMLPRPPGFQPPLHNHPGSERRPLSTAPQTTPVAYEDSGYGAKRQPYPEPRRSSYHGDALADPMPRRPPAIDTRVSDSLSWQPRICENCRRDVRIPTHVNCPHFSGEVSPLHRSAQDHHPGSAYSHPPPVSAYGAGPPPGMQTPIDANYIFQAGSGPGLPSEHNRRRRGNLPKESTAILNAWFNSHSSYPYPKEEEKQQLQQQCGLTMAQISNWFINARRRRNPQRVNPNLPESSRQLSQLSGPNHFELPVEHR